MKIMKVASGMHGRAKISWQEEFQKGTKESQQKQ